LIVAAGHCRLEQGEPRHFTAAELRTSATRLSPLSSKMTTRTSTQQPATQKSHGRTSFVEHAEHPKVSCPLSSARCSSLQLPRKAKQRHTGTELESAVLHCWISASRRIQTPNPVGFRFKLEVGTITQTLCTTLESVMPRGQLIEPTPTKTQTSLLPSLERDRRCGSLLRCD
jgi:hypothetical protein